ncbi:SRPBCC family protein [Paraburkholderia sp. RL18-103-BIB-C]|jgi:uncharacterized protein|uniref:SRPBCC family protein n=1 Tax=unclassified Paraburkholderia TaxID=2615204 RepID=UPI0038B9498C
MKVVLEKVFPLAAPADHAWQLMQNIEAVAGCMPGAKVTERVDDTHYKGTITVRLGPATMSFKGNIEVVNLDSAARSLNLVGKGADTTGSSAASMDLVAAVQATGETCELTGRSEVTMSGKAAALGARLMGPVADQMLKQFVANFAARLQTLQAQQTTGVPAAPEEAEAPRSELNGLALAWAVFREWLRGLFSHKTA